jgi:hypothetical protein
MNKTEARTALKQGLLECPSPTGLLSSDRSCRVSYQIVVYMRVLRSHVVEGGQISVLPRFPTFEHCYESLDGL